jgi:hypothetical protein
VPALLSAPGSQAIPLPSQFLKQRQIHRDPAFLHRLLQMLEAQRISAHTSKSHPVANGAVSAPGPRLADGCESCKASEAGLKPFLATVSDLGCSHISELENGRREAD